MPVPGFSTILGMISSCKGEYFKLDDSKIGYTFTYESINKELVKVLSVNKTKSNIGIGSNSIMKEFLYDNYLHLYTTNKNIVNYFRMPEYALTMGRRSDIASILDITSFETHEIDTLSGINGTVVDFKDKNIPANIHSLSKHFTSDFHRKCISPKPYYILDHKSQAHTFKAKGIHDPELKRDIYWQE